MDIQTDKKKEDCSLCNVSDETINRLKQRNISKKERYLLKRKEKDQKNLLKINYKRNKKIIKISLILIIAVLIIGGTVFGIINSLKSRNPGVPSAEIVAFEYDAGTVSIADGLVKHTYEIKNNGIGDLKIKRISTSCLCTTAHFRDGNRIAPGETGYLEVVFDPNYHGSAGTGNITRGIYLSTNDPNNKEIEIILIANVTE